MGESVGTEFTRVIRQSLRGLNNSTLDKYGRGSRHTWLSKEQIATIRYIMQHPDIRPSAWTSSGHGDVEATDIVPPILNATPKINRVGLKNWQIIYTAEEVMAARAQGKFATNDGYIFIAEDVLDPASFVFSQAFSLPRATGGSLRSVSKKDLSKAELEAVQALLDKRDAEELAKNVTPIEKREGLKNWQIVHSAKERPASSEGWGTVKKQFLNQQKYPKVPNQQFHQLNQVYLKQMPKLRMKPLKQLHIHLQKLQQKMLQEQL